jgi:hypothetical protein
MIEARERDRDQVVAPEAGPNAIEATLNYIVDDGTKIFTETAAPGASDVRTGGKPDPRRVTIRKGRDRTSDFTLERAGFHFIRHDTRVVDFFDEAEVRRVYYPEMEALVTAESGAKRVVVFDHTLRTADDAQRVAAHAREPIPAVSGIVGDGVGLADAVRIAPLRYDQIRR